MAIDWTQYEHFSEADFPAEEGEPSEKLLALLDLARATAGVPFVITSGVRDGDSGAHGRGLAADIRTRNSRERFLILQALFMAGVRRVGVYDHHTHADCDASLDQDVCWWGTSQ